MVTIPGTRQREELSLNDVIQVTIEAAEKAVKTDDWRLGYALTVHSSQGLTIKSPQKVWIIDDYLQWSNLAYLAVSRVEYIEGAPPVNLFKGGRDLFGLLCGQGLCLFIIIIIIYELI